MQLAHLTAGRRRLLYAGAVACGLASVLASTAPSLWLYTFFRCASGAALGGMGLAAFALATDVAGPSWRGFVGLLLKHFFSGPRVGRGGGGVRAAAAAGGKRVVWLRGRVNAPRLPRACSCLQVTPHPCCDAHIAPLLPCAVGACAGVLLAWCGPGWRLLTFLCGLACLAYLSTWSFVTESPQWLLLHGKKVGAGAGGKRMTRAKARGDVRTHSHPALLRQRRAPACLGCPKAGAPPPVSVQPSTPPPWHRSLLQGEATAALAAIAFASGSRPPEHPLADPTALLANTQVRGRDGLRGGEGARKLEL